MWTGLGLDTRLNPLVRFKRAQLVKLKSKSCQANVYDFKKNANAHTHKVGDCFELEGGKLSFPRQNKFVCIYALSSLLPLLPAKQRKIDEPDDWLLEVFEVECPDPKGRVIWEITCKE